MSDIAKVEPAFLSTADAAAYLGISQSKLYRKLEAQDIDSRYDGGNRLVVFASLKNYAAALPTYPSSKAS